MLFRADKVNLSNETYVKTLFYYMTSKDLLNKRNRKKKKKETWENVSLIYELLNALISLRLSIYDLVFDKYDKNILYTEALTKMKKIIKNLQTATNTWLENLLSSLTYSK